MAVLTPLDLQQMKRDGKKIAAAVVYEYQMAKICEAAGVWEVPPPAGGAVEEEPLLHAPAITAVANRTALQRSHRRTMEPTSPRACMTRARTSDRTLCPRR